MQALASIAEIVQEILKRKYLQYTQPSSRTQPSDSAFRLSLPTQPSDSAFRIIAYLQRYLPYIARGSRTPSDVLQWEETSAVGRPTTADDWSDFVRRTSSWGDRAFRQNMASDPEDLLRMILAILDSPILQ
jgi:hypothetical protein